MANGSDAAEQWLSLKVWYQTHLPEVIDSLNPGVDGSAFDEFDEEIRHETGHRLPRGLRDMYTQNNGQNKDAPLGAMFGLWLLSLEEMRTEWHNWRDMALSDPELAKQLISSYPSQAIRPFYIDAGRIPFAYDWGGNHLGIDMNPGSNGRLGQIINFGADEPTSYVLAPSLASFLKWLLSQYQGGNYHIVSRHHGDEAERSIEIVEPFVGSFLDVLDDLFGPNSKS